MTTIITITERDHREIERWDWECGAQPCDVIYIIVPDSEPRRRAAVAGQAVDNLNQDEEDTEE
jgi:hypothetical protein